MVQPDSGIEVTVELPGLDEKDIEVSITEEALTVKGEKKIEKKGYYVSERSYGSVYRSIPLPAGVDADKAEANFKNGVLIVSLPQRPEARARVSKGRGEDQLIRGGGLPSRSSQPGSRIGSAQEELAAVQQARRMVLAIMAIVAGE